MNELQNGIVKDLEAIRALPNLPTDVIPLVDSLLNPLKVKQAANVKLKALRVIVDKMNKELEKDGIKLK